MKIYKLSVDYWDRFPYDSYYWFVVIANSRKDAIDFVVNNKPRWDEWIEIWKTAKVEYIWETHKKKRQFILEDFNAW